MEGNSCSTCSSICFDAVNVKNELEYGFNEQVHVKEEVVECLKEEAAWEDSAAAGEAAALASLYAGHEVKDEFVLGPEGLQPRDVAFTLYAAQALAVKKQPDLRDGAVRLERSDAPAPLSIQPLHVHPGTEQEDNGLSARARGRHRDHTYARTECPPEVHVKEEEDSIKAEPEWEDNTGLHGISAAAARAGLYANHEVKDELVLGPEGVQPPDIAFTLCACQSSAARAQPALGPARRPERHVANNADVGNQVHSHANIHTEKQTYVCDICNKRFALKTRLVEHVMIHIHQEPEQEEIRVANNAGAPDARQHPALRDCAVRLERLEVVALAAGRDERLASRAPRDTDIEKEIHGNIDVSTEEQTYICDTCKKRFPLKSQLVDHVMSHIQGQESRREAGSARGGLGEGREPTREDCRHACLICYKDFPTPSKLKTHERTHTGERPFSCGICKQKFTQLGNLKRHERTHTGQEPFSCGICQQKFTQLGHLKRHERIHTGEKPFSCGICKQKFTKSGNLKRHERIHTGEKPFSCGICKQKFTKSGNLKRHERIHTGEKPFSCGICKQKFTQLSSLKTHERTHTGEKPFSCEICQQKFTLLQNLKRHERTHTGQRPFSCGICQQKFTQLSHLKSHERIHTGERPFSCRTCNKEFTQSSNLKTHERAHTEERPFSCGICKQNFTNSGNLKCHERIHTGEKPFSCRICKQKFTQSSTLKIHERTHTGQRPFFCGMCKQKFTQSGSLKRHERTHK